MPARHSRERGNPENKGARFEVVTNFVTNKQEKQETKRKGVSMGMFKFFDMPKKELGESLNTADRLYLIKLIVITGIFTVSMTLMGVQLMLERYIARMGDKAKVIMEWSKKADLANEMLNEMFKVQQIKKNYESQGIGAEEVKIKQQKQEVSNETKN